MAIRGTPIVSHFNVGLFHNNDALFFGTDRDVAFVYDVSDANAAMLKTDFRAGGAVDVPVHAYGIDIADSDLALLNGQTQAAVAIIDAAKTSYVALTFAANGQPAIEIGGVATVLYLPAIQATQITILAAENFLYITESDQTDPAGRWRFRADGDVFYFEHALTASWASDLDILTITAYGKISTGVTRTSQTARDDHLSLTFSTDSTYRAGDITWSGNYGSSVISISGTHANTTGGFHGVSAFITADNDYSADGHGVIVFKGVTTTTDTAVTHGDFIGGQFIAKKAGTGTAATSAVWYGAEAWFYETGSGIIGTGIGGNFGWHADSSAASHIAGTVWRGVQVFCDNSGTSNAEESTGLYIWPMAGTTTNALCIGTGLGTFTTGLRFVNTANTITTAIKFGGTAIGGAANVTITTGIDMTETIGMATGITIGTCSTSALVTSTTLTSQTTENKHVDVVFSTDSTYKSANILYSGSTASTALKVTGTHTNTSGGFYGIASFVTASNNYAADGDGAIAVRGIVTTDGSTITNGDITGAFFCGKKTGANDAATSFILYGIEAFAYMSGSGVIGTAIGANFGYHADTSADCSAAGTVWRALQVFCDNVATDAYNAEETTGLYIWPHSGQVDNALCIGTGTGSWTTGIRFVGPQSTAITTGIKFGGTSAAGASNLLMTTGIDMSETSGMTTMLVGDSTLTSQTTENKFLDVAFTTDSSYIAGTNIIYSGAYTSSVLKIVATHTGTTGGLHGILVQSIMDQDFTASAEGMIGIKSYLDMTDSAITEGNFMAGAFIAKKSGSGTMATGAILHGIESWTYCTSSSVVGTMIGGNIGYHADSSGDCSAAGTVWKALQIFVDNGSMANPAQETCGIDIWLMAGTVDNALKIGPQAGTTFTTGLRFVSGGTVTTGIKFGGAAIGTAGNVTMTTGIDMDEVTGMVTGINIGTCSTASIAVLDVITVSPEGIGTLLDFILETEWTAGTLIRADFASSTTQTDDICGMTLDFGNLAMLATKQLHGYHLIMPAYTQTSADTTSFIGFYLSAAGALEQNTGAGTINWFGASIAMPNVTETTGTIVSIGLAIAGGTKSATAQQFGIRLADNLILALGTTFDQAMLNRSTTLGANTALADVLIGTPVAQALAANSLMISNVTASGDIAMYVNKGGHSQMVFFADGSAGDTAIMAASGNSVDIYIAGTKEYDFSATAADFNTNTLNFSAGLAGTSAITYGTLGTALSVAVASTTQLLPLVINMTTTGTGTGLTCNAIFGNKAITNNQLRNVRAITCWADFAVNVDSVYTAVFNTKRDDTASTVASEMFAVGIDVDLGTDTTSTGTPAYGIKMYLKGDNSNIQAEYVVGLAIFNQKLSTNLIFLETDQTITGGVIAIHNAAAASVPSAIVLTTGVATDFTYGIDMNVGTCVIGTADIRFHHGGLILDGATYMTITPPTGAYLSLGGEVTSNSLAANTDLVVGKLEANGYIYADGGIDMGTVGTFLGRLGRTSITADGFQVDDLFGIILGNSSDCEIQYVTTDGDAKCLFFMIDESDDGGNNVPVFAFMEETGSIADHNLFDAFVEPLVCVLDNDKDSWFGITFMADDRPQLACGGAASLIELKDTQGFGTGIAADDYFTLTAYDSTGATRTGMEAIRIQNNTAVTAKIGFYGATPVDQPAVIADAAGCAGDADDKVNAVIDLLQELGLMAT